MNKKEEFRETVLNNESVRETEKRAFFDKWLHFAGVCSKGGVPRPQHSLRKFFSGEGFLRCPLCRNSLKTESHYGGGGYDLTVAQCSNPECGYVYAHTGHLGLP